MIPLFTVANAAPLVVDRVDILSEVPGSWLHDDAPRLTDGVGLPALRFAEQVTTVLAVGNAEVGLALGSQSVGWRQPLGADESWFAQGWLVTRAFLPVGTAVGVAVRPGRVRIGLSVVALSEATWIRPVYAGPTSVWTLRPTLGVGIGRRATEAPWM